MLGLVLSMLLATAEAPERCSVIIPHPSGSGFTHQPVPGYSVAEAIPPLALPEGYPEALSILCARDSFFISDNDFRVVLDLGISMMVGGDDLFGTLEFVDGRFRFTALQGEATAEQQAMIQAAMNRGQQMAPARPAGD